MTTSLLSPEQLLANLFSNFPVQKKSPPPKKPHSSPALPLPYEQVFALKKTGYKIWKATHKIIEIQPQICSCCRSTISSVRGEFFALENGLAHATWIRTEAYGIEAAENLPIHRVELPLRYVEACAYCTTEQLHLHEISPPIQLSFPF